MSDELRPYRVAVPDAALEDLRDRLARTRWPDQIPEVGWELGAELGYVKELCAHWRDKFDWRAQEAQLNAYEHYTTEIDGQNLHCLVARSKEPEALPLVITHGWPGSVVEFLRILPLLTDPVAHGGRPQDAFHVVCPSMPGYGFSGPTRERGWDTQRIAEAEIELMRRLGFSRYGAQGGDWGSMVTVQIGRLDPEHCAGIHLNMVMSIPQPDVESLPEKERQWVAQQQSFLAEETGYQQIQGSKPQTLGYGLTD